VSVHRETIESICVLIACFLPCENSVQAYVRLLAMPGLGFDDEMLESDYD